MKKKILWTLALVFAFLMLLFSEALAVISIIRLDMLPQPYLYALIGVFALLAILVGLLMFLPGKGAGKGRKVAACVLTLILVCGCAAVITVATDVMDTLAASSEDGNEVATREIYVRMDDEAQETGDLATYTVGYMKNYDDECTSQVLAAINAQTETPVATAGYTHLLTMLNALLEKRIDAMVFNSGYISILEETEEFEQIGTWIRQLDAIPVVEPEGYEEDLYASMMPIEEEEEEPTEETLPEETEPTEEITFETLKPFIVYVSGSDTRSTTIKGGRNDVNILAVVNPMTKQVLLVNTPRDYYVKTTASSSGAYDKLTHCGIYGLSCSMKTLGKLYDQKVEYYVRINFSGFRKLINSIGGIEVYSDKTFTAMGRTKIVKGMNTLTGGQALDFARDRKSHSDGDNARGRNQMQVIKAVIKKATSGTTIISNYTGIMESMEGMFKMNIPTDLISTVMKMQLSDMAQWNVVTYAATGYNDGAECYSMPGMKLSVVRPYQSSVKKATTMIDMVLAGEILTEEVVKGITD